MRWTDISRDVYDDQRVSVKTLIGEIKEVGEELLQGNMREAVVEVQQCLFYVQLIAHQRLGWNLRPLGVAAVIEDFYARLEFWKKIFEEAGLQFHVRYLAGGSNYTRPYKVQKALDWARADQAQGIYP